VKWAGAPQKMVDKHPVTSQPALMPRTSFHIWTEEMRGRSREWTELEIETAHSLFVNLMELMRLIHLRVRMVEETIARQKSGK
jgi:light-regulated signal transduction histidine kinase (bacteriophytochrome)